MNNVGNFLHASDPVAFVRDRLHFDPDPWQQAILRDPSDRILLCCCRQWGKSTTIAALAVHHLLFHQGPALAIAVSRTERQSAELVRKARRFLVQAGFRVRGDGDNPLSILLPSGNRLIGLPGKEANIRGFSAVTFLAIEEAARVPDEAYQAVRPMLAVSQGRLIALSTPYGKLGFFHDEWHHGRRWSRYRVTALECPRFQTGTSAELESAAPPDMPPGLSPFLAEEWLTHGDAWFRQEYLCEFVDETNTVFPRNLVERAFRNDIQPLWPAA